MLGDVQHQAGLPHRRAGGDDDQVARLHAARHAVQIHEAGRHAGDELLLLEQLLDLRQALFDDLPHRDEALLGAVLRDREDRLLGFVEDRVGVVLGVPGPRRDGLARVNQRAQRGLLLDDPGVVLDVGGSRHAVHQARDVGRPAHVVELAGLRQRFLERDGVDGPALLAKRDHLVEDAPVAEPEEILRAHDLRRVVERLVVDQDRAKHGALGFEVVRQRTLGGGDDVRHGGGREESTRTDSYEPRVTESRGRTSWIESASVPGNLVARNSVICDVASQSCLTTCTFSCAVTSRNSFTGTVNSPIALIGSSR